MFLPYYNIFSDPELTKEIEKTLDFLTEKESSQEEISDRCPKCGARGFFIKMALVCKEHGFWGSGC